MNRRDAVFAAAYLEQVAANLTARAALLREGLEADARAEYEEQATAPTWRIPDVATVSGSVSRPGVSVVSPDHFAQWVANRYPTEAVVSVRPSWQRAFLASGVETVDGDVCDKKTGEIVPGLCPRAGGEFRSISIKVTPDAAALFAKVAEHTVRQMIAGSDLPAVRALEAADVAA
jgi:hypothetical protein